MNDALHVRHVAPGDSETLLTWRNDPWVVRHGAGQRTITGEEHAPWFAATLERTKRELFLVEIGGTPAGMVRYDFTAEGEAEISLYLTPPHAGRGYGTQAVQTTAPGILIDRELTRMFARVRTDNDGSLRFFHKLGFREHAATAEEGIRVLKLERGILQHSRPCVGAAESAAAAAVVASSALQGPGLPNWNEAGPRRKPRRGSRLGLARFACPAALGVGPGDEVVVPAYSCVGIFNAVLALGGVPVLADVMPECWNVCVEDARRRRTPRTRALVAVHLFGHPAEIRELASLGVPVIEDCAHGVGGQCDAVPFGGAGTISIGSFHATKLLAAGEGGIAASRDHRLIDRIRLARDYADQPADGRHLNDKMTTTAAIALVQLARLPDISSGAGAWPGRYDACFAHSPTRD